MTNERWSAMTNQEKYDFLSTNKLEIKPQGGLRLDAKVGDDDAVVTRFRGEVCGVVVSHWCETQEQASKQSLETINNWKPAPSSVQ